MSVQQLAQASMVGAATIEAVETGRLDPEYDLLLALADGLGVGPGTLVTRAEQEPRSGDETSR